MGQNSMRGKRPKRIMISHDEVRAIESILDPKLEQDLDEVFAEARREDARQVTVERLLLRLLDDPEVREALASASASIEAVTHAVEAAVRAEIAPDVDAASGRSGDVVPAISFQRVLQRAVERGRSSGRQITPLDVVVAILEEQTSHAAEVLVREGAEVAGAARISQTDHRQ